IARAHEMTIYAGAINRDHVHMLIGIPPHLSEYQSLRKRYWGQHLWGRGYWVATSGNVTDEVWKKYIEDQKPEVPDDNFKVVCRRRHSVEWFQPKWPRPDRSGWLKLLREESP